MLSTAGGTFPWQARLRLHDGDAGRLLTGLSLQREHVLTSIKRPYSWYEMKWGCAHSSYRKSRSARSLSLKGVSGVSSRWHQVAMISVPPDSVAASCLSCYHVHGTTSADEARCLLVKMHGCAPQCMHRWGTWLQDAGHLLHVALLVGHVLPRLTRPHQVEAVVWPVHLQRVHHLSVTHMVSMRAAPSTLGGRAPAAACA